MALGGVTRSISIALNLAADGFNAGLRSAGNNLNSFANGSEQSLHRVAAAAGVASAALGAGLAIAVTKAMDFEQEMSNVAAVSGATGQQFDALRQQALDLGASTVFTATEVAKAQGELSKAGVSTADIMGGALKGALDLAAAANIDLAMAAEITATQLNNFGLFGRDASHVADVLAAAANKSAADVSDMALALKQVGAVAQMTGMGLEETNAALSIFANAGVKGSDAGTSLKTMLLRLNPQTDKAAETMAALGLNFENATGGFVDMEEVAGRLREQLSGLSDVDRTKALQQIFGTDAIRAATLLYEAGADGVAYWNEQVDDSGYAAEVARIKMDNLAGDVEKLGGAFDTVLIQSGEGANGTLRGMVQAATSVVDIFGEMPSPVSTATVGVAGLATAVTGVVAGLGVFIPMARNVKGAMDGMGGAWSSVASTMTMSNFTKIAGAVGVIGTAFTVVASQIQGAKRDAEEANAIFLSTLGTPTNLAEGTAYLDAMTRQLNKLGEEYQAAAEGSTNFDRAAMKVYEGINIFGDDAFTKAEEQLKLLGEEQGKSIGQWTAYRVALDDVAATMGYTREQVEAFAQANGIDLWGQVQAATAGLEGQGEMYEWVNGRIELTAEATDLLGGAIDNSLLPSFVAAEADGNRAAAGVISLEDAMTEMADETKTAEDRLNAFSEAVDRTISSMRDSDSAKRDTIEALWEMEEAAKAVNETSWHGFNDASKAAFRYQDQVDSLLVAVGEEVKLAREFGASQEDLNAILNDAAGHVDRLGAEGVLSAQEVAHLRDTIYEIPHQYDAHINVHTGNAWAAIANLGQHIRNQTSGIGARFLANADGNIIRAYAAGGMENHVAQIAPAGAMRLWAEPETGGESYIPHAPSKRARSVEILRQTNEILGSPLGGNVSVDLGGITVNTTGGDGHRIAAEIMTELRRNGELQDAVAGAVRASSGARDGSR